MLLQICLLLCELLPQNITKLHIIVHAMILLFNGLHHRILCITNLYSRISIRHNNCILNSITAANQIRCLLIRFSSLGLVLLCCLALNRILIILLNDNEIATQNRITNTTIQNLQFCKGLMYGHSFSSHVAFLLLNFEF